MFFLFMFPAASTTAIIEHKCRNNSPCRNSSDCDGDLGAMLASRLAF